MTKVVNSAHTQQERTRAINKAITEDKETNITKIKRKELQAALKVGYDYKENKYKAATEAGIKVTPLIISTGGTMHTKMYKCIKKLIPDSNQRRWFLADIAIILARGRGQLYAYYKLGVAAEGVCYDIRYVTLIRDVCS